VSHYGEMKTEHRILVTGHESKRPLGRSVRGSDTSFKMDFKETGYRGRGLDSSGSGYGPLVDPYAHSNCNFGFHKEAGCILTSRRQPGSSEGICSM
jgi:hypothetical protein